MRLPHTYLKVKSLKYLYGPILPVANMNAPLPEDILTNEAYAAKFDTENPSRDLIQSLAKIRCAFLHLRSEGYALLP